MFKGWFANRKGRGGITDVVGARGLEYRWEKPAGPEDPRWLTAGVRGSRSLQFQVSDDTFRLVVVIAGAGNPAALDAVAQALNRDAFSFRTVVLRDDGDLSLRVQFYSTAFDASACTRAIETFTSEVNTLGPVLQPLAPGPVRIPLFDNHSACPREPVDWAQIAMLLAGIDGETEQRPMGLRWSSSTGVHEVLVIPNDRGAVEDLVLVSGRGAGRPTTSVSDRNAFLNSLNVAGPSACAIDLSRGVLLHRTYLPVGAAVDAAAFVRTARHHHGFWSTPRYQDALRVLG